MDKRIGEFFIFIYFKPCFPKKVRKLPIAMDAWNEKASGAKSKLTTLPHF